MSRLASLTNDLSGTANDLSVTFAYNPASQIKSTVRTGDAYAWTGHGNGSTAFTQNGLNQQITIGGAAAIWDTKGNLTTEPQTAKTYGYSSENLLTSATGGVTLGYDPALRLYQTVGAATTRFLYDGVDAIAEYSGSNALQRRFVFDPTTGQPVLWYEGNGTAATNRRYLSQDERGSVISVADSTGASLGLNSYDEYGKPGAANLGRYQYTGQKWVGEAGLYDYKARNYLPHLGIFAQTDPIGQVDNANLYAYVLDDPVNLIDPLGLGGCPPVQKDSPPAGGECAPMYVNGMRIFGGGTLGGGVLTPFSSSKPKPPTPKPQNNNTCPAPPWPGAGKSAIDQNIADAQRQAADNHNNPAAIDYLANLEDETFAVVDSHSQNYKQNPKYIGSAAYGNFNFGATMQARGFSLGATRSYSDAFQRITTWRADPPEDVRDVTNGYKYAQNGCNHR